MKTAAAISNRPASGNRPASYRLGRRRPSRRSRHAHPNFLLPLLLVSVAGCEAGEPSGSGVTIRDSAGVMIVESASPTWLEGEGWRVAGQPILEIGVVDGDPRYQFDRIRAAARAPGGHILVADGGSQEIRVYDAAGRHITSFGGVGEGPGEFRSLVSMVLWRDTVFAYDARLARLSTFDLSGRLLGTISLESTGDAVHPLRLYGLGGIFGGDLAMTVRAFPADRRSQPVVYWDTLPTLRYSREGTLLDTIGEFVGLDTHSTPRRAGSVTFGRYSSWYVGEDRLYMTDGGGYEVRVYEPGRGLVRVLRALAAPRPVTDSLLEAHYGPILEAARTPEQRRAFEERRDRWPHAETLPWISALRVDETGHIWVREYQTRFDRSSERWGVFDPDGRWLGRVEMPAGLAPSQIGRDYVLGVARGPMGVELVRVYVLER